MRLLPLRRSLFWSSLVVVLLASAPATADPVDYIIFDSDTLVDLGLFTVDPALAGPSGPIRSVGIRTATTSVPEPSTLLLSSIAAGVVVISSRRRHRVSERARRQSTSQQRFVHS